MSKYIFLMFFLSSMSLFPNDSRTLLGSTVEIIDSENTTIIMRDEVINISLYKEYYEVDVTINFYNEGTTETVLLGFPIMSRVQTFDTGIEITDFKTYINGILVSEYSTREETEEEKHSYVTVTKWYLREVTFPENEHTVSRVMYRMPYSNGGFFIFAGYIYGTGKSWKGNIGKMTVNINHDDDILINHINISRNTFFNFSWEGNGRYRYTSENFQPESLSDEIEIFVDQIDLARRYDQFDDWAEGWIWDRYLLYKNETDIRHLTRNQVRLFINYFYAHHGYEFKNPFYRDYFIRYGYKINPNFSVNDFNEYEQKNIAFLLKMESMIP